MKYIQSLNINPSTIKERDNVTFTLSDGSRYFGRITQSVMRGYYVEMERYPNSIIFDILELPKEAFVHNIVGYSLDGLWPEVRTLEDLGKVLRALLKVNRSVEEVIEEKVEEKLSPSEWDWLLG